MPHVNVITIIIISIIISSSSIIIIILLLLLLLFHLFWHRLKTIKLSSMWVFFFIISNFNNYKLQLLNQSQSVSKHIAAIKSYVCGYI